MTSDLYHFTISYPMGNQESNIQVCHSRQNQVKYTLLKQKKGTETYLELPLFSPCI